MAEIQLISDDLIASVKAGASESARLRLNHNFHTGPDDNPHRFLNVLMKGTYVRPHRHLDPPKSEGFLVLEGWVALFVFSNDGAVQQKFLLGRGPQPELPPTLRHAQQAIGIDLPPGVWHTLTAITDCAVCYEVKPGPWNPATDKEFAQWAPNEGDDTSTAYLASLLL